MPIVSVYTAFNREKTLMNQTLVTKYPVNDRILNALEVTLRGCEELIPQDDWLQKLAKSEATGGAG
jgi:tyrosyl-tRNA synthetase